MYANNLTKMFKNRHKMKNKFHTKLNKEVE